MIEGLGWSLYALALIGSGFGLAEILGLLKDKNLTETFGISSGLGVAFSLILMYGTLAFRSETSGSSYVWTLLSVVLGITGLGKSVYSKTIKARKSDAIIGLMAMSILIAVYLFYLKYPIFPPYNDVDMIQHAHVLNDVLKYGFSLQGGLLYYGFYALATPAVYLTGLPSLEVIRGMVYILALTGLPLTYVCAKRVFNSPNENTALIASAFYTFSGVLWIRMMLHIGLFPNFTAILMSLFLGYSYSLFWKERTVQTGLILGLSIVAGLTTHYTILISEVSFLVFPFFFRRDFKQWSFSLVILGFYGIVLYRFYGTLVTLATANQGGGLVPSLLTTLFSYIPAVSIAIYEYSWDLGVAIVLFIVVYFTLKQKRENFSKSDEGMVYLWLLTTIILSFAASGFPWRESLVLFVPLYLLSGRAFSNFIPEMPTSRKRRYEISEFIRWRKLLVLVLLVIVISGSRFSQTLYNSQIDSNQEASSQYADVNAMTWMNSHICNINRSVRLSGLASGIVNTWIETEQCRYLSITDWRLAAYSEFYAPNLQSYLQYDLVPSASCGIAIAEYYGYRFVVSTAWVPPDVVGYYNQTVQRQCTTFHTVTQVWNNSNVYIFELVPSR